MTVAITVLMAVHNGAAFLRETLESVSTQSFTDYEFLIVDDASQDTTPAILAEAAAGDPRIKIHRNAENVGLTKSLNLGLQRAAGRYIARIDADDVCLPQRLGKQFEFLERHPGYTAVACGYQVIDGTGRCLQTQDSGLDDWQVRWLGGFNPPAPHPTYFFRRTAEDGSLVLYDEAFRTAQDFDLWSRLAQSGKTCVLPEVLIRYRRHAGAITVTKRKEQAANCARTGRVNLARRLPRDVLVQLEPLLQLFAYQATADRRTIAAAVAGCDAMLAQDLPAAPSAVHRRWLRRMTAGLLADAVLSRAGGLKRFSSMLAFAYHARAYLPALAHAVVLQPGLALKSLRNAAKV